MKPHELLPLYTEDGERLQGTPHDVYPRPTLVRDSFLNLNGEWHFSVTDKEKRVYDGNILVPFPPEALLSGVHRVFRETATLTYERQFTIPDGFCQDRIFLHFGAIDQVAAVSLNGHALGTHVGGYDAFSFDITPYLLEENTLTVTVTDRLSEAVLPYGKQRGKRGGMWYTPTSGIWQTVWLESVPAQYIESIRIDTTLESATVRINGVESGTLILHENGGDTEFPLENGTVTVRPRECRLWSPESPYLYRFTVRAGKDEVRSYFALRTVSVGKDKNGVSRLCLNGKPYFFHGVLDQGYFSDGIYTPATLSAYTKDIEAMKSLGFNMLRKHIKVEPPYFYYECDRLGMAVFQDMVNNGKYSFLFDTALPTVGIKKLDDRRRHKSERQRNAFLRGMESTVDAVRNHPSVVYYTVFNEGWGQFCADDVTARLRTLDESRVIDATSGWFRQNDSDVDSLHVYFKPVTVTPSERPIVLSEFGGYSYKIKGHSANEKKTYGYRLFTERSPFESALTALYRNEVIPMIEKGLSADVYTQLSDVEDETNGFLTYDRRVMKVSEEAMKKVAAELFEAFKKATH